MNLTPGLVASSVPFSVVDGPGSRYVLFLQGCNFNCGACHNPSTIARWPTETSTPVEYRTVDDITTELRGIGRLISGITVSGGEATLQLGFLVDLFAAIKTDQDLNRLSTLVDTNGTPTVEEWERLGPFLDGAMVDLKACSPGLHHKLTGAGNTSVKDSIRWLSVRGKLTEVRLLVIEGVTDDPEELEAWAEFVSNVDPATPVRLMGFRHQGARKVAKQWPETSGVALNKAAEALRKLGLANVTAEMTATSTTAA